MKKIRWIVLIALGAALPFTRVVVAADFADTLDRPAVQTDKALHGVFTGLASASRRLVAVGQRGHIFYSDDAGLQWHQAKVPVSSDLVAVHFPSPSLGWAVGHDGVVLHSSDAGESWSRQFDGRDVGSTLLAYYRQQAAARPDDEAVAGLLADAQRVCEEGADKPFLDVWFENDQVGYIVGAFNLIFRTDNGGRSWTPWLDRTDNPSALNLYALRPAGNELFVVGEQGLVLKLDPASERFKATPTPYNGSFFGVVGKPGAVLVFGLRGNAYRSVDGGANWNKVELGLPLSITASTVTADGRIILLSQAGHVLVSNDDGVSFNLQANNGLAPVAAAQVSAAGALVLAGTRGLRQLPLE
ncbi:WD40/YVTN/BNR-like repeat-containing protein [Pseudomonas umsongensis]|uniref:WD40/YVTN/BNR-like repeat-containing protein n=1 Tax=Pseudomonas umsongensis TaxID=198618 RepID=UPI0015BB8911|nr:YCF48-related protein [Pseudomonas umsongensis]NWL22411.1 glycosyl hydrolase [Pseudomonas umsongensis]